MMSGLLHPHHECHVPHVSCEVHGWSCCSIGVEVHHQGLLGSSVIISASWLVAIIRSLSKALSILEVRLRWGVSLQVFYVCMSV